jgi:hypothetical protein
MIEVPDVPHRGMAVANMHGIWMRNDALCGPGFAADDQIITAKIELLECHRHEWQVLLVHTCRKRQVPDEGCCDPVTGDGPGDGFRQIDVGVYISIRIEFAKCF